MAIRTQVAHRSDVKFSGKDEKLPDPHCRKYHFVMRRARLIISDLDNTIYNWVDGYIPCLRRIIHTAALELNTTPSQITQELKTIFSAHSSIEFAFSAFLRVPGFSALETDRLLRLISTLCEQYLRAEKTYLKAYPTVKQTLRWAMENRIPVIGITNAPLVCAARRLRVLGIEHLFRGLIGWEGPSGVEREHEILRSPPSTSRSTWYHTVSTQHLKPNPYSYRVVQEKFNLRAEECVAIGDSLEKDIRPALELGMTGVWAEYGRECSSPNMKFLLSVTPWTEARIKAEYSTASQLRSFNAARFQDLRNHLAPLQQPLPIYEP